MTRLIRQYRQWLRARLKKNEDGVVATEFAVALPMLLIILSGIVEVGNFLLLNIKAQHTVIAIGDLVTRGQTVSAETIGDVYTAVEEIMAPYPTGAESRVIVSAISLLPDGNPEMPSIIWQCISPNSSITDSGAFTTLTPPVASDASGLDTADFSAEEITMRVGETVIVTEFLYQFRPLVFEEFIDPNLVIRRKAYFRPRIGSLVRVENANGSTPEITSGCLTQEFL